MHTNKYSSRGELPLFYYNVTISFQAPLDPCVGVRSSTVTFKLLHTYTFVYDLKKEIISRKHGKKEPQLFFHCGSFDHPDMQLLNDYKILFFILRLRN